MLYFKNNDRVYIGSSINVSNRVSNHKSSLKGFYHTNSLLQRDYNIYGRDNLCWKVLEEFDDDVGTDTLLKRESEYILKYKSHIYGYNKTCIASNRGYSKNNYKDIVFEYKCLDMIEVIKMFLQKYNVKFELIKSSILRKNFLYPHKDILSYRFFRHKDIQITKDFLTYLGHDIVVRKRSFPERKIATTAIICPYYITDATIYKEYFPIAKKARINKCLEKLYTNRYKKEINNIYIACDFNPYKQSALTDFRKWEYKLFCICRELEEGRLEDEITITVLDKETLEEFERIQKEVLNEGN